MSTVAIKIERRGGKRDGAPRLARCGHLAAYSPGPARRQCEACAAPSPRVCQRCGISFAGIVTAKFCSTFCRDVARGVILTGPRDWRKCALPECGVGFVPYRSAVRCCSERHGKTLWNREARATGRAVNPWSDRRRSNAQARRARQAGTSTNASVFLSAVVARDGLLCALCGVAVDMELRWPDRMSKSVDHVIPISRGGAHTLENCQLAHLSCNSRKGNRLT